MGVVESDGRRRRVITVVLDDCVLLVSHDAISVLQRTQSFEPVLSAASRDAGWLVLLRRRHGEHVTTRLRFASRPRLGRWHRR